MPVAGRYLPNALWAAVLPEEPAQEAKAGAHMAKMKTRLNKTDKSFFIFVHSVCFFLY